MPVEITWDKVREMVSAGAQLVEVLPPREYGEEHLPGAISIPLKQLTPETVAKLDQELPVIVYCWDYQCDLSRRAAWRLESLGFKEVYDYAGGKADWLANDFETEGEATAPRAGGLARRDVLACQLRDGAEEVAAQMRLENQEVAIVVHGKNVVMGRVRIDQLDSNDEGPVELVMESGPSTFRPNVPLAEMLEYMDQRDMESALITTNHGVLVGILHRSDAEKLLGGRLESPRKRTNNMADLKTEAQIERAQGRIRSTWGDITDDDFQQAKGDTENLIGRIKEKTGDTIENIRRKMDKLLSDEDA